MANKMNYQQRKELENAKSEIFSLASQEKDIGMKIRLHICFKKIAKVLDNDLKA